MRVCVSVCELARVGVCICEWDFLIYPLLLLFSVLGGSLQLANRWNKGRENKDINLMCVVIKET